MKFVYMAGPVLDSKNLKNALYHALTKKAPIVINHFFDVSRQLQTKFTRIRESFRDDYNPKFSASLDNFILKSNTRQKKDYHRALSSHINQLLDAYADLSRNVILVPGKFDLSLSEIKTFVHRYNLDVAEEKLDESEFLFKTSDGNIVDIEGEDGQVRKLLGIGGVPSFDPSFPDFIQHGKFHILTQTDWTSAIQIVDNGADYLVSSAAIESTYDPDLYRGEAFHIFNQQISAERMILDPCPSRPIPEEIAMETMGIPLVHGKIQGLDGPVFMVEESAEKEEGNKGESAKISCSVFQEKDLLLQMEFKQGMWDVLENNLEAEEETTKPETVTSREVEKKESHLEQLLEKVAPDILVLVENTDEFIDIVEMRLFDRAQHFYVYRDCDRALETFEELNPGMVILEDRLPGTDDFLEEIKMHPGKSPGSVISIYDEGYDPNDKSFRIHEDEYLVEPFEIMQLFALIESELVRSPANKNQVHHLKFSFDVTENNVNKSLGIGTQLIKKLELDRGDKKGFTNSYRSALKKAAEFVTGRKLNRRITVTLLVSTEQLTITIDVEGEDFITSISEKLRSSPSMSR